MWWLALSVSLAGELEDLGRQIYRSGVGPGELALQAEMSGGLVLSGRTVPCGGCHGVRGEGRSEGGLRPSSLRWEQLSRPYEITSPTGRKHGPYDPSSLLRAVTLGVDPAGNPLHDAMPRYRLSVVQAAALQRYIVSGLGREVEPGVSPDGVLLGALLPRRGPDAEAGLNVERALRAAVADANLRGQVYGRTLELMVAEAPEAPAERVAAFRRISAETPVFAWVALYTVGAERELEQALQDTGRPSVGPIALDIPDAGRTDSFYLLAGRALQARALVEHAARSGLRSLHLLVEPGCPPDVVEAARDQAGRVGLTLSALAPGQQPQQDLLALCSAEAARGLRLRGGARLWTLGDPTTSAESSSPTEGKILSFGTLPRDVGEGGQLVLDLLSRRQGLQTPLSAWQRLAVADVELVRAAMVSTGRTLHADGLVEWMRALHRFDAGLLPPLSFGPSRVGVGGAWIVERGEASWVEPR